MVEHIKQRHSSEAETEAYTNFILDNAPKKLKPIMEFNYKSLIQTVKPFVNAGLIQEDQFHPGFLCYGVPVGSDDYVVKMLDHIIKWMSWRRRRRRLDQCWRIQDIVCGPC